MSAPPVAADGSAAGRIPSLDGLRALSITLLCVGHVAGTAGFALPRSPVASAVAELGVRIFFVISGFLITSLLLEEKALHGRISLGRFFLRRTFRIFPAYLAFLLALYLAQSLGWLEFSARDWWHALTYTVNYHAGRPWEMGHLWSLSVEEQFYAIWPALLLLVGTRRGMLCATAILVVSPVLRLLYLRHLPGSEDYAGVTFETAADALAIGCLLAWYRDRLWADPRWRALVEARWLVPALFALAYLLHARTQLTMLLGLSVLNLAIALLIERSIRLHDRGFARALNLAPVAFLGTVSYSLYLWQQPFLNRQGFADANAFPANLALAFAACLASYYLVERPALRLRARIERRLTRRPTAGGGSHFV